MSISMLRVYGKVLNVKSGSHYSDDYHNVRMSLGSGISHTIQGHLIFFLTQTIFYWFGAIDSRLWLYVSVERRDAENRR